MPYDGSCHCGAVTFTVAEEVPVQAVSCNCSVCRSKGLLLAMVPRARLTLHSGEDSLCSYLFHTQTIQHQFCATCGTETFAVASMEDGTQHCAVNLRCVPAVDLDALELLRVDGASR